MYLDNLFEEAKRYHQQDRDKEKIFLVARHNSPRLQAVSGDRGGEDKDIWSLVGPVAPGSGSSFIWRELEPEKIREELEPGPSLRAFRQQLFLLRVYLRRVRGGEDKDIWSLAGPVPFDFLVINSGGASGEQAA